MGWPFPYTFFETGIITTSATPGTNVSTTVLPAPGLGGMYRIIGINVNLNRNSTGLFNITFQGGGATGIFLRYLGIQVPNFTPHIDWFPEPGIQFADNETFVITHNNSIASQGFEAVIYYYNEVNNF